jgi:hypothetical protein
MLHNKTSLHYRTYMSLYCPILAPLSWELSQPRDYFHVAYGLDPSECPLMISRPK